VAPDISRLTYAEKLELLERYEQLDDHRRHNYIDTLFPDRGPLARDLYPNHLRFFAAGRTHAHRLIIAANRVGKSLASCYELVLHCTGLYPPWWPGRKLTRPINWWVCGENSELLRQSIITLLIGPVGEYGTGLVRRHLLDVDSMVDTRKTATTVSSFRVKHVSGRHTQVDFKSYDAGRTAFQASEVNVLFDEEPDVAIYVEAVTRTLNLGADGMTIMNFTPVKGETPLLLSFMAGHSYATGEISPSKHVTHLTWATDAPHLSDTTKSEMLALYPPYIRDARTKGLPVVGEGAVYPCAEDLVFIDPLPFAIPDRWARFFALDFGFVEPTAILWFAVDPETRVVYVTGEHYLSGAPVGTHAQVIHAQNKVAGFPIPGVCDPSGGGTSADGKQARRMYEEDFDLPMMPANNALETGIAKTYQAMITGKLKIYATCVNTRREFRSYGRKKSGFVGDDHAMDCARYGMLSGLQVAESKEAYLRQTTPLVEPEYLTPAARDSWMLS
jgi:phage terminase large subunit-like protein